MRFIMKKESKRIQIKFKPQPIRLNLQCPVFLFFNYKFITYINYISNKEVF